VDYGSLAENYRRLSCGGDGSTATSRAAWAEWCLEADGTADEEEEEGQDEDHQLHTCDEKRRWS